VAYAWAVLALALVPAPAHAALTGQDGFVLCSGAALPADGGSVPLGDLAHCKGCPLNPVLAAPPAGPQGLVELHAVGLQQRLSHAAGLTHRFATGLARPRAPPSA